jgi:predicted RNA-binding Zn ribbon-like protein
MDAQDAGLLEFLNDGAPADPRLARLRELLSRLTDTVALGRQLAAGELAELNEVTGRLPVRARLEAEPDGGYVVDFEPVGGSEIDRLERELAGSFASLLRRSRPPRLKRCAECGRAFVDGTRSRTRRWCDAGTCGNRARVRRHRRRSSGHS